MRIQQLQIEIPDADYYWIAERASTKPSGLVVFPSHAVEKYKKLTGQELVDNGLIKLQMVSEFGKYA